MTKKYPFFNGFFIFNVLKLINSRENKKIAKAGGNVAKVAKDNLEEKLGKSVVSSQNKLNYKYIDDSKLIE